MDLDTFLASCKESGNQAYSNFKDLLQKLQDDATRAEARRFLAKLEDATRQLDDEECMKTFNFRIHDLALSDLEGAARAGASEEYPTQQESHRQTLTLLEMSSIFIPEEWSFTFYEGLIRHPDVGFRDRTVCELGCGNGWISIALAGRFCPSKVWGLDINPRAIKIAWINLYLNALNREGEPILDGEGKTLLDRVEFHESDLLGWFKDKGILLDRVVGCIPQVLTPDPKATLKVVSETMSEEFLYALSNYCSLQGYVEDQFGLGLIARAVEESIEIVKPTGAVILNMGGRPGQAVCERLFVRRGFSIEKLWSTRVFQAQDTDITPLVEIERNSRHRFEFFMGPVAEEPISARTAYAYAKVGGRIAHGLTVYECRLVQPNFVKAIFHFLQRKGMEDTRSALDLSFSSKAIADEKLAFLAHLARTLESSNGSLVTSEEPSAGNERFRAQIAGFLRLYFRIPLSPENVVVLPTRAMAIENLLRLYRPTLALVEAALTRALPRAWLSSLPGEQATTAKDGPVNPVVLQAPQRTDLMVKLARALRPQMIVTTLADFEARSTSAFQQLLDVSAECGAHLFLDISDHLELSSMPSTNGVLQFLAENPLPPHAAIICGLVKNQVYKDLEICFLITESRQILDAITHAGQLTYFRTALMPQLYYGCLLHELLSFQIPDRHTVDTRPLQDAAGKTSLLGINPHASAAFAHPAIGSMCQGPPSDVEGGVVHMDETPSALPSPAVVQQYVFEGFVRQHASEQEMDPRPELLQLLGKRFAIGAEGTSVILGEGSLYLFAQSMAACSFEGGSVLLPSGSFGTFVASAKFYGNPVHIITTDAANSFKLTPAELSLALGTVTRPWLVLSAPVVNPTGAVYSSTELQDLLAVCRKHGARVIIDAYYAGLEFGAGTGVADVSVDLKDAFEGDPSGKGSYSVAVMAELSPKLSLGGILFACVAVRDPFLKECFANAIQPHGTTRYAIKKLAGLLCQGEQRGLKEELAARKAEIAARADKLVAVLKETGWDPIPPQGGIFLIASPTAYQGRTLSFKCPHSGDSKAIVLDNDNITGALYDTVGLRVNSSRWTGIPGYCRFVFSMEQSEFELGLEKLKEFQRLVHA